MNSATVRSQEALYRLFDLEDLVTKIVLRGSAQFRLDDLPLAERVMIHAKDAVNLYVDGPWAVYARDHAHVYAKGHTQIIATDNAAVAAGDFVKVAAFADSHVYAHGTSKVSAYERARVWAYDNSLVRANESVKVIVYDSASVQVYGPTVTVELHTPIAAQVEAPISSSERSFPA